MRGTESNTVAARAPGKRRAATRGGRDGRPRGAGEGRILLLRLRAFDAGAEQCQLLVYNFNIIIFMSLARRIQNYISFWYNSE